MEFVSIIVGGLFLLGVFSFIRTAFSVTKQVAFYDTTFFFKAVAISAVSALIGAYFGAVEIKIFVSGAIGFLIFVLYEINTKT